MSLFANIRGVHSPEEIRARADAAFRDPLYEALPRPVARYMRTRAASMDRTDYRAGNQYVSANAAELMAARAHKAFDESAVQDAAAAYSRRCARLGSLQARVSYAQHCGIDPAFGPRTTLEGRMRRLADVVWWRRQLRRAWTRRAENALREVGMVRRMVAPYASDVAVEHHGRRQARQRDWIESGEVVNTDTGEVLPLAQCVDASAANPAIRRGELMVRARGFEEIAAFHKHAALFVTLTTPSRFHAELMYGGKNPAHARETVRAAQQWLCLMWARARAKLKRLSVLYYGIRVAEPHHDGTPHWHMLLFVRAADQATVEQVLRGMWLSDAAGEPGAREHRCKFEAIDSAKGSAAGYLAKYVSKNIDGAGAIGSASDEETGDAVGKGINRVAAWASVHGIRQFQQLGGPAVTLYRELRRLREPHSDPDIERAREAADAGRYCRFVLSVGGIAAGRRANLRVEREGQRRAPFQAALPARENYYGEPCRPRIVGVAAGSTLAITRPHRWRIERKRIHQRGSLSSEGARVAAATEETGTDRPAAPSFSGLLSDLGPVAITVRGTGEPAAWTNPNETSRAGPPQ